MNNGKLVGAKPPLRPTHVWLIRIKPQIERWPCKLCGCDLVAVCVDDVAPSGYAMDRATIRQKKTVQAPVWFELTDETRLEAD